MMNMMPRERRPFAERAERISADTGRKVSWLGLVIQLVEKQKFNAFHRPHGREMNRYSLMS